MSLLNLGYGLGGFMQGYDQQQQNALRNSVVQQQLAQLQRQYAAQRILGGLGGGSLGGLGGGLSNFQQQMPATSPSPLPLPQFGGDSGSSTPPPQPPPPGQSSVSAPSAATPSAPPIPAAPSIPLPQDDSGNTGAFAPIPPPAASSSTPLPQDASGNAGAFAAIPPKPAPPPIPPAPALPTPAAAPPTATPTSAAQETPLASAADTASTPDRSGLFGDLLNPSKAYEALGTLRDRIAQAAPEGTDPAVIWEATQELYKLTGGSALQRAQLGAYLRLTGLDETALHHRATEDQGAARVTQAQQRLDVQKAGQAGVQRRFDAREARMAADKAYQRTADKDKARVTQLRALIYSLTAGAGGAAIDEDTPQGRQLKAAQDELAKLSGVPQSQPQAAPPSE